jgi:hypothetical protein
LESPVITGNLTVNAETQSTGNVTTTGTVEASNLTRGGSQVYSRNNILGTVSQSGGVPTGAIIERGSNANGEFVKYADGTMICRVSLNFTRTATWTHPVVFSETPSVVATVRGNAVGPSWPDEVTIVTVTDRSATITGLRYNRNISSQFSFTMIVAIGRWF